MLTECYISSIPSTQLGFNKGGRVPSQALVHTQCGGMVLGAVDVQVQVVVLQIICGDKKGGGITAMAHSRLAPWSWKDPYSHPTGPQPW